MRRRERPALRLRRYNHPYNERRLELNKEGWKAFKAMNCGRSMVTMRLLSIFPPLYLRKVYFLKGLSGKVLET